MTDLRRAALAGTVGFLALGAGEARGQVSAYLDLGSGNAAYDGLPGTTILALSPYLAVQRQRWSVAASGAYTAFERGGWSGQGSLAGSWFTPRVGPFTAELGTRADHSERAAGFATGQLLAQARAHVHRGGRGAWVGVAAGQAWSGPDRDDVARAEAGVWAGRGDARVILGVSRAREFDTVPAEVQALGLGGFRRVSVGFTEATAGLEWASGPVELVGALARRLDTRTSFHVSGTLWLNSLVGVIAGAGRYSPDPWQAHPGGRYATLSLRVGLLPQVRARLRPRDEPAAGVLGFEATEVADGRWLLRVRAPRAHEVEVMGDFSDWQPLRLLPRGRGVWTALVKLAEGTYRINLRVDRGPWGTPPGVGAVEDDFSGTVGVLVITPKS